MNFTLKTLAAAGALALIGSASLAQDVTWRVPTSVPEGSPFYVNFLERFADNVTLMTDGAVEVQLSDSIVRRAHNQRHWRLFQSGQRDVIRYRHEILSACDQRRERFKR